MATQPGTRLGTYEVTSHIGSGGMGEVYRAHDNKLGRDVAIKVLPERFASDFERLARFQREAKLLASLNHPNIATIHGLEQSGDTHYLVMELVPGDTLRDRILRDGALPIDEALKIAKQIAEALEAAHNSEKAIIHRDLKPANIKITPEGRVKVLDFGLAKAFSAEPSQEDIGNSPTLSINATTQGVILGTAAYMSPEQAKGKPVNKSTDIFAFGAVLYEMLTGRQAFQGDDVGDILAAVVMKEPSFDALPANTPPTIHTLLRRCLRKDRNQRLADAGAARIEIEDALSGAAGTDSVLSSAARSPGASRRKLLWVAAFALGSLITGTAVWLLRPGSTPAPQSLARLTADLPSGDAFYAPMGRGLALSPDGSLLVYVGVRKNTQLLFSRALDGFEAKALTGTDGALAPFFSPNGQWIGFFAEGKLKKIAVTGGSPQTICDSEGAWGAAWGPDNTIYFAPSSISGLFQVSAQGGAPQPFTKLDPQKGEVSHRFPQVLPGGKGVLFTVWTGPGTDESHIQLQMLGSGERRVLVPNGNTGYYISPGYLIYQSRGDGTLLAVPFNLERLDVSGAAPVTVAEQVLYGGEGAHFAVSSGGQLAYAQSAGSPADTKLVWVSRNGKVEPLPMQAGDYRWPQLSPDGKQVAFERVGAKVEIWLHNFATGTSTKLSSADGSSQRAIWAPDGKYVTYRGTRNGTRNLYRKLADGSGDEERLTTGPLNETADCWSPDGQTLIFDDTDLFTFSLNDRKRSTFLKTPFTENAAILSHDGRWLAYQSDQSGRYEVYVQPYPAPGARIQISTEGGAFPRWNRNGRELFYLNGNKVMVAPVTTQSAFSAAKPVMLFEMDNLYQGRFDVSLDGQRLLLVQSSNQAPTVTQINVVLNWAEELKRRVPTGTK